MLRLLRRKKRARSLESNAISFIFAYHESRGNTIVARSRETRDRSSSASQTKIFVLQAFSRLPRNDEKFHLVSYLASDLPELDRACTCFKYSFSNNNFALLFNSSLYNDESDEVSINSWSKFWVIN